MEYPNDEILLARGKYATLAGERREALKGLQEDMMALQSKCSLILRIASGRTIDSESLREEIDKAANYIGSAHLRTQALSTLAPQLDELRPLAWGKGEVE